MHTSSRQIKKTTQFASVTILFLFAFTTIVLAVGGGRYTVAPWSFGLNGDTQWTLSKDPTGQNPDYVSAAVARAFNQEFIQKGVKFVVQVGDLTDRAGKAGMFTRATVANTLYEKHIGFFPLRGNHETYGYMYNLDPDKNLNIPSFREAFPQTQGGGANTVGTTNFSSPDIDFITGLSYSFDYGSVDNNARFVIVDAEMTHYTPKVGPIDSKYGQTYYYLGWILFKAAADLQGKIGTYNEVTKKWSEVDGTITTGTWFRINSSKRPSTNFYGYNTNTPGDDPYNYYFPIDENISITKDDPSETEFWPGSQQSWITERLTKATRGTEHAFVFSHRGLMSANHPDGLFGASPAVSPEDQNAFYASLMNNGVRYMISGHDHIYNRAIVKSPDGLSQVEQLTSIGGSTKFYAPAAASEFANTKQRETQISQELYNIGYYIYTVDGPRVTVDYYSDAVGNFTGDDKYPDGSGSGAVPNFNFIKKETWGYSLNGQQFIVAQGGSYTGIEETFGETSAKILTGTNSSTATDFTPETPRALTKTVNTGWVANPTPDMLKSDIFSLWGMSELGAAGKTDTYVLSMSVNWKKMVHLGKGSIGVATFVDGKWANAVDQNFGGEKKFVVGPYSAEYGLGTYGVDPSTKTAWAVLNFNADFAVRGWADGDQDDDGDVDDSDVKIVTTNRNNPASVCPSADIDKDGKITILDVRKIILLKTVN